jgi:hypothetical protein
MTYHFKLRQAGGSPAEPPSMRSAILNWRVGDTIPIHRDRMLRVVGIEAGVDDDDDPVLIVEDRSEPDTA